jgi:DNA-binding transcriptional ArsR family regulator
LFSRYAPIGITNQNSVIIRKIYPFLVKPLLGKIDRIDLSLLHYIIERYHNGGGTMGNEKEQLDKLSHTAEESTGQERPLLTEESAAELEAVFKMLGNRTRLRMIYALTRAGEMCVTDLAAALEMKPQAVSNQLQRLTDRGILASKRTGINIYYRVVDTCVVKLLDRGIYLKEV